MEIPLIILKNQELEKTLLNRGYVIVPFFDKDAINQLIKLHKKSSLVSKKEIYANTHSSDIEFKKQYNNAIKEIYKPFVEKYFIEPLILGGSIIAKPVGGGVSHPHLDWSLVEEGPYRSCNVWVPLVDLTKNNGAIEVLPGSHKLGKTYRGPNIPDRTNDLQEFFWKTMTTLYMKAGEALIYDHRLIHGSKDNLSDTIRYASACAVTNMSANLRLFYLDEKTKNIEVFEGENTEHLLSNDRFSKPKTMKSLGFIKDYPLNQLTETDFSYLNLKNKFCRMCLNFLRNH